MKPVVLFVMKDSFYKTLGLDCYDAERNAMTYSAGTESPLRPRWERPIGTHQIGFHDQRGKAANKPTLSKREANATPPAFAHYLIDLAETCKTP